MQNRSTTNAIIEVLGNPDIAGIILFHNKGNKEYGNFRLTCKYMYNAVDNMPFGLKLSQANSLKPYSINEFIYNHPYLSAGTIAFCWAGPNIILLPAMLLSSGVIGGGFAVFSVGMFTTLYGYFKEGETNVTHAVKRTVNKMKFAFDSLQTDIILGAMGFSAVLASGDVCAYGLGGTIGLVHDRCEDVFEQRRFFLATGAAVVGFFANRFSVRSHINKRQEIKNEIYDKFFENKIS